MCETHYQEIYDNAGVYAVCSSGIDNSDHVSISSRAICFSPPGDAHHRLYTRVSFSLIRIIDSDIFVFVFWKKNIQC